MSYLTAISRSRTGSSRRASPRSTWGLAGRGLVVAGGVLVAVFLATPAAGQWRVGDRDREASGPQSVGFESEAYHGGVDRRSIAVIEKALLGVLANAPGDLDALDSHLRTLQQTLEDGEAANALVSHPNLHRPNGYRVFYRLSDRVRDALRALPDGAAARYRELYEPRARASFAGAWSEGNARALAAVWQRYPLTLAGAEAALRAAELEREAGRHDRARRHVDDVESELSRGRLPQSDELTTLIAMFRAQPLPGPRPLAPEVVRLPDSDLTWGVAWLEKTLAADAFARRTRGGPDADVAYATDPVVELGRITVASFKGLTSVDLETGSPVDPVKYYDATSYPYREVSPNLRLTPRQVDRWLIAPKVESASRSEGGRRRSSVQKVSIPQRSIRIHDLASGSPDFEWATHRSADPLVASLSFNSAPVVAGDRLYALGWRWSGLVDAFLVCFDLATGEVEWRTLVISNQVELTRFGFMAAEPFLGQIAFHEGTVYVSTNLGAVGAVNAEDGALDWVTTYLPVRQPRTMQYRRHRMSFPYHPTVWWEHSPLVVLGETLYVGPQDSNQLFALSRRTGAVTGQRRVKETGNRLLGVHRGNLVLADATTIHVVDPTLTPEWRQFDFRDHVEGQPLLVDEGVLYLSRSGLRLIHLGGHDVETILCGNELPPSAWMGNPILTVARGAIYVATPYHIACFRPKEE